MIKNYKGENITVMRKKHSTEFKAKVALVAIKGEQTIQEIAQKYEVHPNQITQWKKHLLDNATSAFEKADRKTSDEKESERKEEKLFSQIGKLKVENDFLKKKYRQLYGKDPDL